MKKVFIAFTCVAMSAILLPSCIVSKKKYLAATARADKEHADNVALTNELAQEVGKNKQLTTYNQGLTARIGRLRDSITTLEGNVAQLEHKVGELGNENQNTN